MKALLLINLGTPKNCDANSVGNYLREFLMDPLVITQPWFIRWPLVHWLIVPSRKHLSAHAYQKIWRSDGSPLMYFSMKLAERVQETLPQWQVELAMRYGNPSIKDALLKLKRNMSQEAHLTVLPLYPHYALSSTETALQEVERVLADLDFGPKIQIIKDFYDHPTFIDALSDRLKLHKMEHVVFSFHGLPVSHLTRLHASCCQDPDQSCCDQINLNNRWCYRAQCVQTAKRIAEKLKIPRSNHSVAFQSRLGRSEWIKPFTDILIQELPKKGVKKIAVLCPSFIVDCLETLEEVDLRLRESFLKNGGTEFQYIPCLNTEAAATISQLVSPNNS